MNLETEYIDYSTLYEQTTSLINYTIQVKENLNKIDSLIKGIDDKNLWNSKVKDSLLEKYLEEREKIKLLYLKLVSYTKILLDITKESEETSKKVSKIIESIQIGELWQV